MESQSLPRSSSSCSPSSVFLSPHPSPFLSPPHTQNSCFSGNRILSFFCSTYVPEPEEETPNTCKIRTLEEREPNSIMDLHHHNPMCPPFFVASSEQPCSPPWAFSAGVAAMFRPWLVACNQNSETECRGENSDQKKPPSPFIGWTPFENPDGHCIIKERMTQALRYFKESTEQHVLAQVWAPIKNGGRYVLTTAGQPFVIDPNSNGLYDYRMVSLMYMFSVDEENDGVLDLPGRVFRQKLPEWSPDVQYYTINEYSRLDQALHHNVHGTLALPVFEPSGQSCVGVLELILTSMKINYAPEVDKVCKALEAVNLKSSEILDRSRTQICNEGRQSALVEILEILTVVCETHKLPLAQTWVPCRHRSVLADGGGLKKCCSSFDGSCMGRVCMSTSEVAFYLVDAHMWGFREACAEHHLQKGQGVAGKAFLSHDACFCKDVTQFCKIQYPLVHYARMFGLTSCFAICLRSSYTGHDEYVLEFFLPSSITNSYEQRRLLGSLLATMKEHLKSLKIATGKEIEEVEASIEMIQALPHEKLNSISKSPQLPNSNGSPPGFNKSSTDGEMEPVNSSNQHLIAEVDVVADSVECIKEAASKNVIPCIEDNGAKKKAPKKQGKAEKRISLDVLQQYHAGSLKDASKSLGGIPSTATSGVEYEVFLSFHGPDTREGFTDHLYTRLTEAGIKVYKDDEELRVGEEIGPELLKGIAQSKIAIPVFSKGYAASKWCLKELARIVECKRSTGLQVMPIFYHVTPSEVRNQTGDYREAFRSHEKCYGENIIREWKGALRQVGYITGWDVQNNRNRQEGKLVKEVTKVILRKLKKAYLVVTNHLVGVEHQVEKILKIITAESGGVRIGGIYGMGGIGKTTLAKVVYNHLLPHFESYSFLADIRENSRSKDIEFLQRKLILDVLDPVSANISNKEEGTAIISERFSNKKVLILLDDVDEYFQLEALIARRDQFGYGSRIIITTRNKSLLDSVQVDWSHEVSGMDSHQALQLFSMHCFRNNHPPKEYATLSKRVVKTTGGLPLALQVVGSLLCGKSKKEWDFTLKKLERVPHNKVGEKLRISFEALDDQQKQVFLDIACFFIGADVRIVNHFWDDTQLCPEEAIEVLLQMSLIKVQEDNSLWMHDQLRDLGREIIRQEHIEPEKRSRLWNQEEATKLFLSNMGEENVRGICLDLSQQPRCSFSEEFAKLPNLRLLHVNSSSDEHFIQKERIFCDQLYSKIVSSNCFHKNPHIFPKLRLLSWHYFPETNATSYFSLENLAILDLSWSKIKSSWGGWKHIKMATNLKVLNLTGCRRLVRTPDFSYHLLLERLILEGCYELVEIDASISKLEHLAFVNLKYCRSLRKLPKELSCMKCLEELIIDKTSSIVEIPNWQHMEKLKVFSACYCRSLTKFSSLDFIGSISKLSFDYSSITSLPVSIGKLVNLLKLSLVYCEGLKELPESIGNLASLIELDLSFSGVVEIPHTIGNLKNLKSLSVCRTPIRNLPAAIGMMESLLAMNAEYCCYLHDLPKLPQSLISLRASHSNIGRVPDLTNLINLKNLALCLVEEPFDQFGASCPTLWWIRRLTNLETLSLGCTHIISLPVELGTLSQLTILELFHCDKLKTIPMLPSSLTTLLIAHCSLLQTLLDLPSGLTKLSIHYCNSIGTTLDISYLRKLSCLSIWETPISKLEGLFSCQSLLELHISCCSFSEIDGLEMLENLTSLSIHFCVQLRGLPDLSKLKMLKRLEISYCDNLAVFPGRMESLHRFDIDSCKSLKKIPDIPHSRTMSHFFIRNCGELSLSGQ